MWCDFLCDGCPSFSNCHRAPNGYDLEEIQHKTVRTSEEYEEMYNKLLEERWEK